MQPQIARAALVGRVADLIGRVRDAGGNLATIDARAAVDDGVDLLVERGILVSERHRLRVRNRIVLRYYARTIEHLHDPGRPH
jgi:hypothetical protein